MLETSANKKTLLMWMLLERCSFCEFLIFGREAFGIDLLRSLIRQYFLNPCQYQNSFLLKSHRGCHLSFEKQFLILFHFWKIYLLLLLYHECDLMKLLFLIFFPLPRHQVRLFLLLQQERLQLFSPLQLDLK